MSAWPSTWPTRNFRSAIIVLSGGELAAAVVVDAVARLKEGVLGKEIRR